MAKRSTHGFQSGRSKRRDNAYVRMIESFSTQSSVNLSMKTSYRFGGSPRTHTLVVRGLLICQVFRQTGEVEHTGTAFRLRPVGYFDACVSPDRLGCVGVVGMGSPQGNLKDHSTASERSRRNRADIKQWRIVSMPIVECQQAKGRSLPGRSVTALNVPEPRSENGDRIRAIEPS